MYPNLDSVVSHSNVPYIGPYVQAPFSEYLEAQKVKLHRRPDKPTETVS